MSLKRGKYFHTLVYYRTYKESVKDNDNNHHTSEDVFILKKIYRNGL